MLFAKGCDGNTNNKDAQAATLRQAQDDIHIVYEASSRGYFEKIEVNKADLSVAKDRSGNATKTTCSKEDWDTIISELSKIDAEKVSTLEAPTNYRFSDGAAHATLTIKYKDKEVTSNTFDHKNPPKELKALVDKILLMSGSVEKQ